MKTLTCLVSVLLLVASVAHGQGFQTDQPRLNSKQRKELAEQQKKEREALQENLKMQKKMEKDLAPEPPPPPQKNDRVPTEAIPDGWLVSRTIHENTGKQMWIIGLQPNVNFQPKPTAPLRKEITPAEIYEQTEGEAAKLYQFALRRAKWVNWSKCEHVAATLVVEDFGMVVVSGDKTEGTLDKPETTWFMKKPVEETSADVVKLRKKVDELTAALDKANRDGAALAKQLEKNQNRNR